MKHKYFLCTSIVCFVQLTAFTQPTIKNQKTLGGSSDDVLNSMYVTKDGGLIVGGEGDSNISGDKTKNNCGSADYWVVKLNKKLEIQWDKTVGGKDYDALYALQQTKDEGYILGGVSASNISCEKT